MSEKVFLFQYGSNMDSKRLNDSSRLDGAAQFVGTAVLPGCRLLFDLYSKRNQSAVADFTKDLFSDLYGVLYEVDRELVVREDGTRSRMDEIEGVRADGLGNYQRIEVTVMYRENKERTTAYTYVGTDAGRKKFQEMEAGSKGIPKEYMSHILLGAK